MLHSLFHWLARLRPGRHASAAAASRQRFTPAVESLEGRTLPATSISPTLLIGGSVYEDVNGNGIRDAGELGIGNNPVELRRLDGTVIGHAQTDANGYYLFSNDETINASSQSITKTAVFGTVKANTTRTLNIDKFDSSLGTLTSVDIIIDGKLASQVRIENLEGEPVTVNAQTDGTFSIKALGTSLDLSIHTDESANVAAFDGAADFAGASNHDFGVKFSTGTKSKTLVAGTDDVSGFLGAGQVTLTASGNMESCTRGAGNFIAKAGARSSGTVKIVYHYTPGNRIEPGSYVVHQAQQPAGYITNLNTDDNIDPIPGSTGGFDIPVTIYPDNTSLNNHFGEVKPASVSGYVFHDVNDNGVKDPGETIIPGATIHLLGPSGDVASATTNASGFYQFANLPPNLYTIKEDQPGAYFDGKEQLGSLGGSSANDLFFLNLKSGDGGMNYDFGELLAATAPPLTPPVRPPETPAETAPTTPPLTKLLFIGGDWSTKTF